MAVAIAVASFMGLLLVYGLNTWLPQLMAAAGYTVSTGLVLLLVLNVGAVVGLLVAGILADKHGTKKIVLLWFGLSAVLLAVLSVRIQSELLLNAAVFVTGVFVFSSQVLVYAWVSQLFPARLRATALGFAAGVGRFGAIMGPAVTGTLVAAGIAYPWGFYAFAAAAVIAAVALVTVPHTIDAGTRPARRRRTVRGPAGRVAGRHARRSRRQRVGASTTAMPTAAPMTVSMMRSRSRMAGEAGTTSRVEIRASGVTKTCATRYWRMMNISAPNWQRAMTSTVCHGSRPSSRIPARTTRPRTVPMILCTPRRTRCRVVWPTKGTTAATMAQ